MSFDSAANYLKSSLVFSMSLGSKELFHSNIWAYLIENDHKFLEVFYPSFPFENLNENMKVKREYHHRDLTIWFTGEDGVKKYIVIENKIKSIPYYEQLERYTYPLNGHVFAKGILTGIGENVLDFESNDKLNGYWDYVNYKSISKRIIEIANESTNENIIHNIEFIKEYCTTLDAIDSCLNDCLSSSKKVLDYECSGLDVLRIDDVYKKLKGADFLRIIKDKEEVFKSMRPEGFDIQIFQDFHNGKATLDIRFVSDADKDINVIGVQLEGYQFRICVQVNKKAENDSMPKESCSDTIYERFKGIWFDDSFDKKSKYKTIFGHKTSLSPRKGKKYDAYVTDSYCFVYQYFDIDSSNHSYDELFRLIETYMSKAASLINNRLHCLN